MQITIVIVLSKDDQKVRLSDINSTNLWLCSRKEVDTCQTVRVFVIG